MADAADRERAVRDMLDLNGLGHLTDSVLQVLALPPADSRSPYYNHVAGLVFERGQLVEEAGRILDRILAVDEKLRDMEATMPRVFGVLHAAERERTRGGDSKAE